MAGTTYSAIRSAQESTLKAAAPTLIPGLGRFRPWQVHEGASFVEWCDQAVDPFRVFDIQHGLDYAEEKYLDSATAAETHTVNVLVSYPAVRQYAGRELEDVIEQDALDIDRVLAGRGYKDYSGLGFGLHRCELTGSTVEERASARVLRLTFELEYDRSMA